MAGQGKPVQALAQVLAHLALDLAGMGDDTRQVAEFLEPLDGGLGAAARHARDIVDTVADQGQVVDDALRRHAELGDDPLPVQALVAHGIDQGDVLSYQLRQILVAGGDEGCQAAGGGAGRQGADDVVGFHFWHRQQRQPQGTDHGVERLDLLPQIVRHGRAMGLVVGVEIVAEGLARGIEHHRHQFRLIILPQLAQHVDHAYQGAGGLPFGVGQLGQGVIGAEEVGGGVDEDQGKGLGHDGGLVRGKGQRNPTWGQVTEGGRASAERMAGMERSTEPWDSEHLEAKRGDLAVDEGQGGPASQGKDAGAAGVDEVVGLGEVQVTVPLQQRHQSREGPAVAGANGQFHLLDTQPALAQG